MLAGPGLPGGEGREGRVTWSGYPSPPNSSPPLPQTGPGQEGERGGSHLARYPLPFTSHWTGPSQVTAPPPPYLGPDLAIQDFDTIVSCEISLEMESFNMCKESLISMVIETFDRLRPGLNSFHGELLLVDQHTKGGEHK